MSFAYFVEVNTNIPTYRPYSMHHIQSIYLMKHHGFLTFTFHGCVKPQNQIIKAQRNFPQKYKSIKFISFCQIPKFDGHNFFFYKTTAIHSLKV